jgi:hypothetical protein
VELEWELQHLILLAQFLFLDYTAFDQNDFANGITTPRELVASDLAPVESVQHYQEKI